MPKARVTVNICDNPACGKQQLHSKEEPAIGYHLSRGQFHLLDGWGQLKNLYACSTECLGEAVRARVEAMIVATEIEEGEPET